jgi:hypothetical protein
MEDGGWRMEDGGRSTQEPNCSSLRANSLLCDQVLSPAVWLPVPLKGPALGVMRW